MNSPSVTVTPGILYTFLGADHLCGYFGTKPEVSLSYKAIAAIESN